MRPQPPALGRRMLGTTSAEPPGEADAENSRAKSSAARRVRPRSASGRRRPPSRRGQAWGHDHLERTPRHPRPRPRCPAADRGSPSPPSASAAWGCRSSTAPPTSRRPCGPSTGRSTSASPSSTRPTCTGPSPTSSWSAAPSPTAATRSCSRPSSATCATPTTPAHRRIDGSPAYVRSACDASLPAARRRPHRPLLPAPRRPLGPDRGDRRRDGRAGHRGQGAPPRAERGVGRHDPPRARDAPDHRAADRVLAVDPRPRGRDPPAAAASSASAWCPTPRSGAASSPAPSRAPTTSTRTTSAATTPASPATRSQANLGIVEAVRAVAETKGATPGQVALAWVLAQGDDVVPIPGTKRVALPRGERRRRRGRAHRRRPRPPRRGRPRRRRRAVPGHELDRPCDRSPLRSDASRA